MTGLNHEHHSMSINVINPAYLTVRQWTDFMTPNLEKYGNIGRLTNDEGWREWGAQLLNVPKLSGSIVPDPYQFDDWRAWAQRCVANMAEVP